MAEIIPTEAVFNSSYTSGDPYVISTGSATAVKLTNISRDVTVKVNAGGAWISLPPGKTVVSEPSGTSTISFYHNTQNLFFDPGTGSTPSAVAVVSIEPIF